MGFIFEPEIDQIINTVRAQTIGEGESITLRDLQISPIHPALKAYFRAEVEALLESERAKEVRSGRFPYAHPEVLSLRHQTDLLLIQHYEFPNGEFERVLDEAVHFQFNYLCRPQFTLLEYIVGDRRRVPVSEIMRKLNRCVEYEYFPELIRRYCEGRGLAEVTYEEFKQLLTRIDAEVVSRHTADELAAMTRSLISFVDFGRASPHDDLNQPTLPTNAAVVFFEDKGLDAVTARLEIERDERGRDRMTYGELARLLREVWSDAVEGPGRPVGTVTEDMPPPRVPEPPPAKEEPPATGPLPAGDGPEERPAPSDAVVAGPSLADVHDLFTKKDAKRFVKSIFGKNDKAFREALDAINQFSVWDDASHYLDQMFVMQDVDPFSKEAVEFTDRIYSRFFPS